MANNKYYIRRDFKSEPMEDLEVKNAIFNKGLKKALEIEVNQNLDFANKTYSLIDRYAGFGSNSKVLPIPFHIEAWRAFVSSGMLFILKDRANTLLEAYSLIHEINYLIESLRYGDYCIRDGTGRNLVFTLTDHEPCGEWVPFIIRDKIYKLKPILQKIKFD